VGSEIRFGVTLRPGVEPLGELVGECVPCPVLQVTNAFNLPGGTIVNQALESVALDPQHEGFGLISIRPDGKSIVAGTGGYAGRTGRAKMSGWHDDRELPDTSPSMTSG
jgi:hypothetical protein